MLTNLMIAGTSESVRAASGATYPYVFPILSKNSTDPGNNSSDWTLGGGTPTIFSYTNGWSLGQTTGQFQAMPYAYQNFDIDSSYWADIDKGACYVDLECLVRIDSTIDESHAMYIDFWDEVGTRRLGREVTFPGRSTVERPKQHLAWVRPGTRSVHIGWLANSGESLTGTNASIKIVNATMEKDDMYEDAFMLYAGDPPTTDVAWTHTATSGFPANRAFDFSHDVDGFLGPSAASSFGYIDVDIPAEWAARVAAGNVVVRGDFLYTNAEDDDEADMFLQYYTSGGTYIGGDDDGGMMNPIIDHYLMYKSFHGRVPTNAGRIRLRVNLTRADGTFLDAYIYGMTMALLESPSDFPGLISFHNGNDPAINGAALMILDNRQYRVARCDGDRNIVGSIVPVNNAGTFAGSDTYDFGNWDLRSVVWTGSAFDCLWWNSNSHELSQWVLNSSGLLTSNGATTTAAAAIRGHDVRSLASFYN